MVQSMDDVSPTRWHLAHTTWFFETFILREQPGYEVFDEQFNFLFNSYYNTIGQQYPRSRRGLISRPGMDAVRSYRHHVDAAMNRCFESKDFVDAKASLIEVGIQHEQQHQELILTDIKHVLSCNPLWPIYSDAKMDVPATRTSTWIEVPRGIHPIGHDEAGFAFDNETPVHQVHLMGTRLASDLVTNGEYLEFIQDGGYERPEFWLSAGWNSVHSHQWTSPLHWHLQDGQWMTFTLSGLVPVQRDWPVCHVSLFEADAFARWSGHRLPTEFEWEVAAKTEIPTNEPTNEPTQVRPNDAKRPSYPPFADELIARDLAIHPTRSPDTMMGGVWQWTSSSYAAYPGYQPPPGAVGEYNGKFMCNQYVLRGGSVATSRAHTRATYRNFFPADTRWQFSGIRLAEL